MSNVPSTYKGKLGETERESRKENSLYAPLKNKDPSRERARKLTKQQTCVMLRKKKTRIGDSKKGEKYTRMKCVCENFGENM